MARLSKKQLAEMVDRWAAAVKKIEKIDAEESAALAPAREQFEEAAAEVRQRFESRRSRAESERDNLQNQIIGWMSDQNSPLVIEGKNAIAANELKIGNRVIDVKKFLDLYPRFGEAIYNCLSVTIKKAESLIGSELVDQISSKTEKIVTTLRLK